MIGYNAKVLADSLSPAGVRLTTMEATFPRLMLAEFNTHRKLSRNSASSRAIPTKKQIKRVRKHPFVPADLGGAQPGMAAGEPVGGVKGWLAKQIWKQSRWFAVGAAWLMDKLGIHKSYSNRLLEPWLWHTVIVTSTEWDNFFGLRRDSGAQKEFQIIAGLMEEAYQLSLPVKLRVGEWHLPLVDAEDRRLISNAHSLALLSAGRCARVSFDRQHDGEPLGASLARAEKLTTSGHWSPTEHQGRVERSIAHASHLSGNLDGDWAQFRKTFPYEGNFRDLEKFA